MDTYEKANRTTNYSSNSIFNINGHYVPYNLCDMKNNMPEIENIGELWTQMYHDIQSICDDYADKQGKPTKTIDEFLNDTK